MRDFWKAKHVQLPEWGHRAELKEKPMEDVAYELGDGTGVVISAELVVRKKSYMQRERR